MMIDRGHMRHVRVVHIKAQGSEQVFETDWTESVTNAHVTEITASLVEHLQRHHQPDQKPSDNPKAE